MSELDESREEASDWKNGSRPGRFVPGRFVTDFDWEDASSPPTMAASSRRVIERRLALLSARDVAAAYRLAMADVRVRLPPGALGISIFECRRRSSGVQPSHVEWPIEFSLPESIAV